MLQSASAFLTPALCRGRAERRPEHQASSSASASASAALTDCCFDGLRSCFAAPVQEASWCGHMPVPEPRGRLPPRHLRRRSSQRRQHGQAVRHVGHIQVLGRARQHVENVVLVELLLAALAAGGGPSPFLSALRTAVRPRAQFCSAGGCGAAASSSYAVRVVALRPRDRSRVADFAVPFPRQASYRKSTSIETLMVWMTATAQPTAQTLTVVCGSDMSPSQQPVTSTMLTMNLRIERDISVQRFAVRFGHFSIFLYIWII